MKVQVIEILNKELNKKTKQWEVNSKRINNKHEIEFDPLNDDFAISNIRKLRYLFLNKDWYRLSLKSYKQCRKNNLITGGANGR